MIKHGLVTAQDLVNLRVRVQFPAQDQMVSYWLPVNQMNTQNNKDYWIPDIGELATCLMDEHDEHGVVIGTIYNEVDAPAQAAQNANQRYTKFKDGTTFYYDRNLHVFDAKFNDLTEFKYDAVAHALTITLPAVSAPNPNGTVTIISGSATIAIDADGNVVLDGNDVKFQTPDFTTALNAILTFLNTHTHQNGGGTGPSGPPTPPVIP